MHNTEHFKFPSIHLTFTVDGELDLPRHVSGSIGGGADEFTTLVPGRGADEEAAIRIKEKGRTTQVQLLPSLETITSHRDRVGSTVCFVSKTLFILQTVYKEIQDLSLKIIFLAAENTNYGL